MRISHGAPTITAAAMAAKTQAKTRRRRRKRASRAFPPAAVSMGTKANTMLLMTTEFSVSMGPMATASESARACVPSRYAVSATRRKPSRLPVTRPATITSPPRTSGLSTARFRTRSALNAGVGSVELMASWEVADPIAGTLFAKRPDAGSGRGRERVPCRLQRRFVIRMIGDFLYIFRVAHPIVPVDHENGAAFDTQVLNQRAVVGAEGGVLVIGEHLHLIHGEGAAPALLRERQVHADSQNIDARQGGRRFIEPLGLRIANRRIERWHHADDSDVAGGICQRHRLQAAIDHAEIRRGIAGFKLRPNQSHRVASHGGSSRSFHSSSSRL